MIWQHYALCNSFNSTIFLGPVPEILRLTAATGNTVRKALEERRFAEVTRQLASGNLPIATVTRNCGFENDLWVKYVFKRRYGMTMSDWRKRHQTPTRESRLRA